MSLKGKLGLAGLSLSAALAGSAIGTEAYAQARPGAGGGVAHPYPLRQAICSWLCPTNKAYLDSITARYDSLLTAKIDSLRRYVSRAPTQRQAPRITVPRTPIRRPVQPTPQPQRPDTAVAVRDTIRLIPGQRPRGREYVHEKEPSKKEKRKTDRFGAGVEFTAGTNDELAAGGYFDLGLTPWAKLELFGSYSFRQEDAFLLGETNNVLERETVLVGPGTYHTRRDSTAVTENRKGIAEAGLGIVVSPTSWLDFLVAGGVRPSDKITTTYSFSEIGIERNENVIRADTLDNTLEETSSVYPVFGKAEIRVQPKKHINLSLSYNRVGKQNIGKAGFGFNF